MCPEFGVDQHYCYSLKGGCTSVTVTVPNVIGQLTSVTEVKSEFRHLKTKRMSHLSCADVEFNLLTVTTSFVAQSGHCCAELLFVLCVGKKFYRVNERFKRYLRCSTNA